MVDFMRHLMGVVHIWVISVGFMVELATSEWLSNHGIVLVVVGVVLWCLMVVVIIPMVGVVCQATMANGVMLVTMMVVVIPMIGVLWHAVHNFILQHHELAQTVALGMAYTCNHGKRKARSFHCFAMCLSR